MSRGVVLAAMAILCLAQHTRDDYREAYRTWRETDPNLERESAAGGAPVVQRADRLAAAAAKFAAARKTFLESFSKDQVEQITWLENSDPGVEPAFTSTKPDAQFVANETAAVARTMDTFASDPDKGIQQLRQALAREHAALEALGQAMAERQKSVDAAAAAQQAMESPRTKALEQMKAALEGAKEAAVDTSREADAWAEYYRKIEDGAKGAATPITVVPPGVPNAVPTNPIPAPPTVTPVPLARYVGAWSYPQTGGLFHGAQPEFVDVLVHEENGQAKGTVFGRFRLPAGSSGDPILRFDFSGAFQTSRNQVFNLVTSDGTKGTVELIPGPAFNLLEVNFMTEGKAGKIRQADVVLVKK